MAYDPIEDEKKPMSLKEWVQEMKDALDEYAATFDDGNEWHKSEHTWSEWSGSFTRWVSW